MWEIEDKRAELRAELVNLRAISRRERGLNELIRMCNTPCWRFVPANVDVCEGRNG
jgi:hypothetical protein